MRPTVGIFDSGVGGLSVADALHRLRPDLPIDYVADTAWFPYGDRDPALIEARAVEIAERLVARGCAVLVVACNTASSAALERLRERFTVPIVGMEPPLKPAVERSRSGRVAVLATPATSAGERLSRLHRAHGAAARVAICPMPGLADLVEAGVVDGEQVTAMLREALSGPLADGIDAVALGCTHYGFLRGAIEQVLPAGVHVIDAAEPVARRALSLLDALPAAGDPVSPDEAVVRCIVTGDAAAFRETLGRLRAHGASLPPVEVEGWVAAPVLEDAT